MPFLDIVDRNADWLVLDVGAHVGQYTLFAAKMNRSVLAVEPFVDNVVRIHKALVYEKVAERVTLITNAISNERNQLRWLSADSDNIGGQSLLSARPTIADSTTTTHDKYVVETIWLDDLVEHLPGLEQNATDAQTRQRAILKIDIEGHEAAAFEHAGVLFNRLDIRVVFMEWGNLLADAERDERRAHAVRALIDFFLVRGYTPYDLNVALNARLWREWPWDVI